jgi:hypothetical protein
MMSQSDLSKMQYDGLGPTIATRQLPRSGFVHPHLCVGRDYVAAHPRSPQLSGNAGLCRHILSGHLFSRLGMFSARLQWGEDHVGTVFQV